MPTWTRSLVLPLLGGLLGGAMSFGIFLVAAMVYLDILYKYQTLVSGILAIVASLVVLFGVYARIAHDRRADEHRLKRDAFAFATALLNDATELQLTMMYIHSRCETSLKKGRYRHAMKFMTEDMKNVRIPALFASPWREMGLLSPDITSLVRTLIMSIELAKSWSSPHPWLEEPAIPGILSPLKSEFRAEDEDKKLNLIEMYLQERIDHYEAFIKLPLQRLIVYLEAEVEEYGKQLGLDEKTKWLRIQAKARREARRQSGRG